MRDAPPSPTALGEAQARHLDLPVLLSRELLAALLLLLGAEGVVDEAALPLPQVIDDIVGGGEGGRVHYHSR